MSAGATNDGAGATTGRRWIFLLYLALIAAAELIVAAVHLQAGMVLHSLLLAGLMVHGGLAQDRDTGRLAMALALAPLIRLLSLSLPLMRFPQPAWYAIVAVPLLVATFVVVRVAGVSRRDLGLRRGDLRLQLALTLLGLGLGVAEYAILGPPAMVAQFSWAAVAVAGLSLLVFTGFTEELIFRGLLQHVARPTFGRWAVLYVAALFAVMHIGYLSALDVVFVLVVGVLFGVIVLRGGSILGVTLAHGFTNSALFLIMPYVLAHPSEAMATGVRWATWACTAAGLLAAAAIIGPRFAPARAPRLPVAPAGTLLREQRRTRGLTYTDLAALTGLPARLLAEIEHGLRLPEREQILKIARTLGIDEPLAGGLA